MRRVSGAARAASRRRAAARPGRRPGSQAAPAASGSTARSTASAVGRRSRSRAAARRPAKSAKQAAGDAEGGLGQQVTVEVVTVGRPDALGQPDPRVAHLGPAEQSVMRARIGVASRGIEASSPRRDAVRVQPGCNQVAVVVAGHDHQRRVAQEPPADRAQHEPAMSIASAGRPSNSSTTSPSSTSQSTPAMASSRASSASDG